MANNILTVIDFAAILDDYAGRTLVHTPVTKTISNYTGEETLVEGSTANVVCYVMKTGQNFDFKQYGFLEKGDMVGLFKIADSITLNSIIAVNGENFRVRESFDVPGVFTSTTTATYVYTAANLFLIS